MNRIEFDKTNAKLIPTEEKFKSYCGHIIIQCGTAEVEVQVDKKNYIVRLYVCNNNTNIKGRKWIKVPHPEGKLHIFHFDTNSEILKLKEKYEEVFSDKLGQLKKIQAKILFKPDAKPCFSKSRPVSFYKRKLIEINLDEMEAKGIIEKTESSEWAAPIVCIAKKDGKMRICADYSTGLNSNIVIDRHPLPRFEEFIYRQTGGKTFSVIDLASAYWQMLVSEENRHLTTINTQKGLYKFKRLPFGLVSAPAIWQRTM